MVFDLLRRNTPQPPQTKASQTARVVPWQGAGRTAWSPRDTPALTRTGFAGNPVAHRTVRLIAEAAAAVPLVLQDSQQRYDSHPWLALLARPNPAQTQAELLEALYGHLLLSGNAYIEAVAGSTTTPAELHVLRSDRMNVVPGPDGWPAGFDYAVGARKHRSAISRASTRRTTTMACRRYNRRRWRLTFTMPPPAGPRRCWTMRPAPPARWFGPVRMGMAACPTNSSAP